MNPKTARYVAKYVMKDQVVKDTTAGRTPQFAGMSRKPALGSGCVKIIGTQIVDAMAHQYDVPARVPLDGKQRPLGKTIRNYLREEVGREKKTAQEVLNKAAGDMLSMRNAAKEAGTTYRQMVEDKTKGATFREEVLIERRRQHEKV